MSTSMSTIGDPLDHGPNSLLRAGEQEHGVFASQGYTPHGLVNPEDYILEVRAHTPCLER